MKDIVLERKYKMKLTKIRNHIKKEVLGYDDDMKELNRTITFLKQNVTYIIEEAIIRFPSGNERRYDIDYKGIYGILSEVNNYYTFYKLGFFANQTNAENYQQLLNAFYLNNLQEIAVEKQHYLDTPNDGASAGVDHDFALEILFAMAYQEDKNEVLLLMQRLVDNIQANDNIVYSYASLIPMAVYFAEKLYQIDCGGIKFSEFRTLKKPLNLADNAYDNFNPIYRNCIDHILSDDLAVVEKCFFDMCQYHLDWSKDGALYDFNFVYWQYYPIEIIFLLKYRKANNKSIDTITHPLIEDFLPYIDMKLELNEELKVFKEKVYSIKDYSENTKHKTVKVLLDGTLEEI